MALVVSGCSFVGGISGQYHLPPKVPAHGDRPCEHRELYIGDGVSAGISALVGAALLTFNGLGNLGQGCGANCSDNGGTTILLGAGIPTVLFLASGVYGKHMTDACDELPRYTDAEQAEVDRQHHAACEAKLHEISQTLASTRDPAERSELLQHIPQCGSGAQ